MKPLPVLIIALLWCFPLSAQRTSVECATEEDTLSYDFYRVGLARGNDDPQTALDYVSCILEAEADNALALRLRGTINLDLGNTQGAINDLNASLELNPNDPIAFNNRGFAAYQFKWYEFAIKDFERAIELDPGYARPYNNRGLAYEALGNYSEALSDFRRAIELNHEPSLWPRWNIVLLYQKLYPSNDLVAAINDVITTNPDYADAYRAMGDVLNQQGRAADAKTYYDRYTSLTSDTPGSTANVTYNYSEDPMRVALQYAPGMLIVLILSGFAGGAVVEWRRRQVVA